MEIYSFDHRHFPDCREPHDLPISPEITRKCSRKHREFRYRMSYLLRYCSPRGRFHAHSPLRNGPRYLKIYPICSNIIADFIQYTHKIE